MYIFGQKSDQKNEVTWIKECEPTLEMSEHPILASVKSSDEIGIRERRFLFGLHAIARCHLIVCRIREVSCKIA